MRFDLALSTVDATAFQLVEAAKCAEAVGFDGVWTYDHVSGSVLGGSSTLDVFAVLAAMAVATDRIAIGSLVVNATARHPAHINTAVGTIQQLSGGRLRLGLGAGAGPESPFSRELTMFGIEAHDAASRRTRVVETIQLLRALWSGESSFSGEQLRMAEVSGVVIPDPIPPIVIGANGPKMAALAGTYGDGVNLHDWEPDLTGLMAIAAETAATTGREHFEISVEAWMEPKWMDPSGGFLGGLADSGLSRVQLRWQASDGLGAIKEAARTLAL